jgi:hypothetical protein
VVFSKLGGKNRKLSSNFHSTFKFHPTECYSIKIVKFNFSGFAGEKTGIKKHLLKITPEPLHLSQCSICSTPGRSGILGLGVGGPSLNYFHLCALGNGGGALSSRWAMGLGPRAFPVNWVNTAVSVNQNLSQFLS